MKSVHPALRMTGCLFVGFMLWLAWNNYKEPKLSQEFLQDLSTESGYDLVTAIEEGAFETVDPNFSPGIRHSICNNCDAVIGKTLVSTDPRRWRAFINTYNEDQTYRMQNVALIEGKTKILEPISGSSWSSENGCCVSVKGLGDLGCSKFKTQGFTLIVLA